MDKDGILYTGEPHTWLKVPRVSQELFDAYLENHLSHAHSGVITMDGVPTLNYEERFRGEHAFQFLKSTSGQTSFRPMFSQTCQFLCAHPEPGHGSVVHACMQDLTKVLGKEARKTPVSIKKPVHDHSCSTLEKCQLSCKQLSKCDDG